MQQLSAYFASLCELLPRHLPEARSLYLFGGITLGAFSPPWSDIDLIAWVDAPEVTPDLEERAFALWQDLARLPYGDLTYLYVAPLCVTGGPMAPGGGGVPGEARSLRCYRHQHKPMAGYPLSLTDTVSLVRHGRLLYGEEIRERFPAVPADWPLIFLRGQLTGIARAVKAGAGPYGEGSDEAVTAWTPAGTEAQHLWFARHLYTLRTGGEILSKEAAAAWWMEQRPGSALAEALGLILAWRKRDSEPPGQDALRAARLVRPALREFLAEALPGTAPAARHQDLEQALEAALAALGA